MTPGPKLPVIHGSTQAAPPAEQFELVQAGVGRLYRLSREGVNHVEAFNYDGSWWRCDSLILGASKFDAHTLAREEGIRSRTQSVDHYVVMLVQAGHVRVNSNGVCHSLKPGELIVGDMARPSIAHHEAGATLTLYIPRDVLEEALPRVIDL